MSPHAAEPAGDKIARLDAILDFIDVPEGEVIQILGELTGDEIELVVGDGRYLNRMIAALTDEEMADAVANMNVGLDTKLAWMLAEGTSYERVRKVVVVASAAEREAMLADPATVAALKEDLWWHDVARLVELTGQAAPDVNTLLAHPAVQEALEAAWVRSNPAVWKVPVDVEHPIHEEGGWIYFNILSGEISIMTKSGGPDSTSLQLPPWVEDSVIVATFHTHPNLGGVTHQLGPNEPDKAQHLSWGVPGIVRTEMEGKSTVFTMEPSRRLHLAGGMTVRNSWSFPGPDGGVAP